MYKPIELINSAFRKKLVDFVSALIILGFLVCPLKSTGIAFAMGEKIVGGGSAPASITSPATETQTIETRIFHLVNRIRSKNGLNELKINSYIANLARQHSINMATGKAPLGHQGFEERTNLLKREIGGSYIAENVAYDQGYDDPASEAVKTWIASPGHLINIKGKYELTGIGVAIAGDGSYYFTQIFVR
jgi:uncharacterized protein YkwD